MLAPQPHAPTMAAGGPDHAPAPARRGGPALTLAIAALLECRLETGRTHQIRVHLAHLGAPIVGDEVYGRASDAIGRQALHALRLTVPHPADNEAMTFMAQVPTDMVQAWLRLGGSWPPTQHEDL